MTGPALGPEATAEAFETGAVALDGERDIVRVRGPEAREYLQGQCSQDLSGLAPGAVADALVLSVQGKLVGLVRIWVLADDDLAVAVAPGWGEAVHERLRRFKIRVKADLELGRWPLVEVRGPGADALAAGGQPALGSWPGVELIGAAVAAAEAVPRGDPETFEAARIESGLPAMGRELDERTIPHEAGVVPWTVSFTKGCYTGQELVARLDARGARTPKVLRGLVAEAGAGELPVPAPGMSLHDGAREVGTVTSTARSPWRGATVGLCYVRREIELPARLAVGGEAGGAAGAGGALVDVQGLPLRAAGG